jgi:hypothetical protein
MKLAAASFSAIRRGPPIKTRKHKEKNRTLYTVMPYIALAW